jgi:hypothetical protein
VLLSIAARFARCASSEDRTRTLLRLSREHRDFARNARLSPEAALLWERRAIAVETEASPIGEPEERPDAGSRAFAEMGPLQHLEEGTRAADLGTREKAERASLDEVLNWYFTALVHFAVVQETEVDLTGAMEHTLAAQGIVARCLSDLLSGEK